MSGLRWTAPMHEDLGDLLCLSQYGEWMTRKLLCGVVSMLASPFITVPPSQPLSQDTFLLILG